ASECNSCVRAATRAPMFPAWLSYRDAYENMGVRAGCRRWAGTAYYRPPTQSCWNLVLHISRIHSGSMKFLPLGPELCRNTAVRSSRRLSTDRFSRVNSIPNCPAHSDCPLFGDGWIVRNSRGPVHVDSSRHPVLGH